MPSGVGVRISPRALQLKSPLWPCLSGLFCAPPPRRARRRNLYRNPLLESRRPEAPRLRMKPVLPVHQLTSCHAAPLPPGFAIRPLAEVGNGTRVMPPHRHDFYYLLAMEAGGGTHTVDFVDYALVPGSVFFLTPGQVHALRLSDDARGYAVSFSAAFYLGFAPARKLLDFPFFHSQRQEPVLQLPNLGAVLGQDLAEMYREFQDAAPGRDYVIRAYLDVVLVKLSRQYLAHARPQLPVRLTAQLRELQALIEQHYRAQFTLDDYAEHMHVSAKHLSALCRRATNKTVLTLVHERLLVEAQRWLRYSDQPVAQIAYELGFSDQTYFSRFFKKLAGCTPEAFRQQTPIVH